MRSMRPDPEIRVQKITIPAGRRRTPALVLSPNEAPVLATGVLWIHGGGYILGMKEMVHMSRAVDLVKKFGAVVVSPGYRLALAAPYPAALDDCYAALLYMKSHAAGLGIRVDQIVGDGEPFYAETVRYIENLKKSGIPASVDVYHSDMHAFDMMQPDTPLSREAARRFNEQFAYAQTHYFAPQGESER